MPYVILPNKLLFLEHQIIFSILKSPNNAKHKSTPNRSFKLLVIILQNALLLTLKVI